MTDPLDRPVLTDEEKAAQCEVRDALTREAMFLVDKFAMDHAKDAPYMSTASWYRLLVEAAIGHLLAQGFIESKLPEETRFIAMQLPLHLHPNVEDAITRQAHINRGWRD